jgi:hypothetical protein
MRVAVGPSYLSLAPHVQLGGDLMEGPCESGWQIRAEASDSVDLMIVWSSCDGLGVVEVLRQARPFSVPISILPPILP